jgi:hypothetical protein
LSAIRFRINPLSGGDRIGYETSMPDYASILRRSISALPDSSPEMREAVYQRARAALARQLTAVDPPLSTREIQTQHQELEDAVSQLEADYAPSEPAYENRTEPARDAEYFFTEPEPAGPGVRPPPSPPAGEERAVAEQAPPYDADDEDEDDEFEDEERASRTPLLVGVLLLVLVVAGAGAYGYAERERLFSFFDFSGSGEPVAASGSNAQAPASVSGAADQKRPDRLTNGSEAPPAPEPPPQAAAAAAPEPVAPPAPEEVPVAPLPAEPAPGLAGEQQTAAVEDPGASLVEQRAIYYFQGAEGSPGQANPGNVTWAQIQRDSGPAVQATLRLDNNDVTTTVTIYKNNDPSLPASHLVEVQFSGPIGTNPVQRVPALVVKQTEQARGQPLTGAAVPVTNELFWIALSDNGEQVTRNLQLLREGSWFDIPILFNDGTRALLTFEKGIPGDRAFETALAAWTPG